MLHGLEYPPTHPENPRSPYPRRAVPPAFAPTWKRISADLVSTAFGCGIGLVAPDSTYDIQIQIGLGILGLVVAYLFQRRSISLSWQSIAFGFAGVLIGRALLPPKIPDPAGNYSDSVFILTVGAYFFALISAGVLWSQRNWSKTAPPELCDAYQAFRLLVGHMLGYLGIVVFVVGMFAQVSTSAVLSIVLLAGYWYETAHVAKTNCLTRAAVLVAIWFPVVLCLGLTVSYMVSRNTLPDIVGWMGICAGLTLAIAFLVILRPRELPIGEIQALVENAPRTPTG